MPSDTDIQNFVARNIGKWETLTKFLNDIGFPMPKVINYGRGIYEISAAYDQYRSASRVTVRLKPEERHRRQSLNQTGRTLMVDEIEYQLANIIKWVNFERVVRDVAAATSH